MKCEHCGKNEVSFVYRSNINGHVEEKHLCAECAEKLGYTKRLAAHSRSMMQNFMDPFGDSFFGTGGFFGEPERTGSLLDGFFRMPSLMGRMLDNPFDDFFTEMPALGAAPAKEEAKEETAQEAAPQEESRFERWRKLNALKLEMKKAVHQEDFEKAAQLRDQIRELEAKHQEDGKQ